MKDAVPDYNQKKFEKLAKGREDQIDPLILETLTSLDDFMEFKQKMVEQKIHKLKAEGRKDELLASITKPENIDLIQNADIKGLEMAINVTNLGK